MDGDLIWGFVRNISAFVVVILLAYITLRYGLGMFNKKFNRGVLKIIERVMLDPRRGNALYLVQVGSECYLLGISQGSVNLIKELPMEIVEKAQEEQIIDDDSADKISFQEMLGFFKKDKG